MGKLPLILEGHIVILILLTWNLYVFSLLTCFSIVNLREEPNSLKGILLMSQSHAARCQKFPPVVQAYGGQPIAKPELKL